MVDSKSPRATSLYSDAFDPSTWCHPLLYHTKFLVLKRSEGQCLEKSAIVRSHSQTLLVICTPFRTRHFDNPIHTISDTFFSWRKRCPFLASFEGIESLLRIYSDLHHYSAQLLPRCLTCSRTRASSIPFMPWHLEASLLAKMSSLCHPCLGVAFPPSGNSGSNLELGSPFSMVCSFCVPHLYPSCYTGRYRVCFAKFLM